MIAPELKERKVKCLGCDGFHKGTGTTGFCSSCWTKKVAATKTHGMSQTRFYSIWKGLGLRCGVGSYTKVKVCNRWRKFENFRDDKYKVYLAHVQEHGEKNTQIDRIDNDGDYEPVNCRWVTYIEQENNRTNNRRITYEGETKTVAEWARITGIKPGTIYYRVYHGWKLDRMFTPVRFKKC